MKKNVGKLEVQEINTRMRKACDDCGEPPGTRRLTITTGAGKWQKTKTLCSICGWEHLQDLQDTLDTLKLLLGKDK